MQPEHRTQENAAAFVRGPRFFDRDGEVMFEHRLDARSAIGPRPATEADIERHPEAYAAMGDLPETPLGARIVVVDELEPPAEDKVRPYAERRRRAEA